MSLSVYHSRTATGADDPAYDVQLQRDWNASHLFTLNASGSEISGAFGNGGGVSFGLSADGKVTAAAPAGAPSPINFSAGTTSSNIGSVVFSNSGGISFGLNGSTITGTVATNYQSQGAYLTTAMQSNAATISNVRISAGTTSNLASAFTFADGSGVSWGINASTITATVKTDYLTSQSNQNVTAANGGFAFQTLSFSNANNFSFGTSAGSAITGSYTVPTVTNSSWTVSDTVTSATVGRLAFTAANGITMTLSTSNNGNHTVFASYTVPTVTNSSMTVSDAATSGTLARLAFTNLNGMTLSLSTGAGGSHTIVGSHNALTSQSNQAASASNGSFTFQTVAFSNANNVTFGTSAGSIITASVAAPGAAAENNWYNLSGDNTAGNTTASGSTIGLSVQGALTISGTNDSVIKISAPATSSIVGTSGISISTNGSTISVYPKPLSVWDPYPIISGTGTSSHAPASAWFSKMNLDWDVAVSYVNILKSMNAVAPTLSTTNSSATNKWSYSHGLTIFTRQDFAGNSSNMSQWTTASFGMTGSLSQTSSSASVALSWVTNSTGGTTSFSTTSGSNNWTRFFTGLQMFRIPLVTTLTPGEYFIGQQQSTTTGTVGSNFTLMSVSNLHINPQSLTIATITSSGSLVASSPVGQGIGVASAVTTNNTMALSVVSAGTQNGWWLNFSNV